jgi:hypothetical protein
MIIPKQNILYKLSLFQGLEEYNDNRYPNSIFYLKNNNIYFELDVDKHILYCSYNLVWRVFSEQSKYNYGETQRVIKDVVEKYTNWGTITPTNCGFSDCFRWKDIRIGGQ